MIDVVDPATRSRMMAGIKSKDTQPELALRRALHARGLRYRLNVRDLPGSPDLVFPRFKAVCVVHGCFWHRHEGCKFSTTPATRHEFWSAKFSANVERDENARAALIELGWRVATLWSCALRNAEHIKATEIELAKWLASDRRFLELPVSPGDTSGEGR